MSPQDLDPNDPKFYEKSFRKRNAFMLRNNPPPVRDPDQIELPSLPPREPPQLQSRAPEVEINTYDKDGNPQRIVVRMHQPVPRRFVDYRRFREPDEGGLMAAAIISFFVPFGLFLAIWPACAARGSAKTVAIFSIFVHLVLIALYVMVFSGQRSYDY